MKQRELPAPPRRPAPTSAAAPTRPGPILREAEVRAASDGVADELLDEIREHLRRVASLARLEALPPDQGWEVASAHAPHGAARLPDPRRWAEVAEAYRAAAASVARGDLVQAASRLREALEREQAVRTQLPWRAAGNDTPPPRARVPRVFASPRDVPADIDALADEIAHRSGDSRRPGVPGDLHKARPEPAGEEPDDDLD